MKSSIRSFTFCGAARRVSRAVQLLGLSLTATLLCLPLSARAGQIVSVNSISGPGLGAVSVPIIYSPNLNNDNQTGGGAEDNNVTLPVKRFDNVGYIDIEFNVTGSNGVTEYKVTESVDNDTGVAWSKYTMQLGFGTGEEFTLFSEGTGVDFDAPTYDAPPSVVSFSIVSTSPNQLVFSGGIQDTDLQEYTLRIDVPDDVVRFTLRQFPTAVPEPSTIALGALAMIGLVGFARRRRK